jgi:hypothetical protein
MADYKNTQWTEEGIAPNTSWTQENLQQSTTWSEQVIAPSTDWREVIEEYDNWEDAINFWNLANFNWEEIG